MARVTIKDVCKAYGQNVVVHDVNIDIADGELMVLVGPSGCGKTTTLRMIAGLEEITSGTISIGDRVVNAVHPKDRDIAMVFQSYALYPHMTVYDNMAFGLKLRNVPRPEIDSRVRSAAKTLGIDAFLERKPKALSGGQRQRVAMGRAIVRNPAVFLFDEPLSNLDAKFRVTMRVELKQLQRRLRTTTVYVTHDQVEAMTLADRIAVMEAGYVRQVGTPQEVFDRPADRFVASFIGSPAMNFLSGTVLAEGTTAVVKTATMTVRPAPRDAEILGRMAGAQVLLGIRPNAFALRGQTGDDNSFSGRVEVIEHLGTEKYAYVQTPDGLLTVRVASEDPVSEGENCCLGVRSERIHFFGPDGKNVRVAA